MRILVGISGGVDSAVSAYLLKQAGHDVVGGFMLNYLDESNPHCTTKQDLESFHRVCQFLHIPFEILDFRDDYEHKILTMMVESYRQGKTPNPDVYCNSEVKFKLFLEEALILGYDHIATGHYAQIISDNTSGNILYKLIRGTDPTKDQSYFLAGLNQFQLAHTLFPIGSMLKSHVRQLAHEIGLPNADRKDSQGLCFVGKISMSEFLQSRLGAQPGAIVLEDGTVVGTHQGVYQYTIGQRKHIGLHNQYYVIGINSGTNTLIVSANPDHTDLWCHEVHCRVFHRIADIVPFAHHTSMRCWCKLRYRSALQSCIISWGLDNTLIIRCDTHQKGIPIGQICVLYGGPEGQEILGSGEITRRGG
ncbi:MAG TPA: tRNA 2-thiouridine(34) synthase MnmA [Candidatus Absconditabacterales bacterium]|nr:tRNA 2-thiouridine(34) synthase MnmA [Candidatus Absconditabacterales bacterium]